MDIINFYVFIDEIMSVVFSLKKLFIDKLLALLMNFVVINIKFYSNE